MSLHPPEFSLGSVIILGDVMLDRYWHGDSRRISPEAPVPVVHVRDIRARAGGAANVAVNVAALGAGAKLWGIAGDDEAGKELGRLLHDAGVQARLSRLAGTDTITKLRIVSRHQQLLRLDFEDPPRIGHTLCAPDEWLRHAGAVVISDYAKGAVHDPARYISTARAAGIPVVADPKGHDFSRYAGATVITPNLGEFEAVVGACHDDSCLAERATEICARFKIGHVLITRGESGMSLVPADGEPLHLPARARDVYDVTGAGDTVVAVLAAALACSMAIRDATRLANLAAGLVVAKLGTASVTREELVLELNRDALPHGGIMEEQPLARVVAAAHAAGERIVMTNGCFDILHSGHVAYLEEAKSLGDRLIVAVNSDASVARLKGAGRPVNALAARMAMLAALRCVDWVVAFSEDTPERIIQELDPQVLVKGGDNRIEDIPGAAHVQARGGEVRLCRFIAGHSTTRTIREIRHGTSPE